MSVRAAVPGRQRPMSGVQMTENRETAGLRPGENKAVQAEAGKGLRPTLGGVKPNQAPPAQKPPPPGPGATSKNE